MKRTDTTKKRPGAKRPATKLKTRASVQIEPFAWAFYEVFENLSDREARVLLDVAERVIASVKRAL